MPADQGRTLIGRFVAFMEGGPRVAGVPLPPLSSALLFALGYTLTSGLRSVFLGLAALSLLLAALLSPIEKTVRE